MQDALAGSPAQSTKMEVDKTSPKRACGSSRETPDAGIRRLAVIELVHVLV